MYKILCPSTYPNEVVTRYYMDTIKQGIEYNGNRVVYTKDLYDIKSDEVMVVPTVIEAFKLLIKKRHKNVIVWIQGVLPEESYMKNKSKFRMIVLNYIEKYVLKRAKMIFFVSEEMKKHYIKKYKISFEDRSFIMPCFNTSINTNRFFNDNKYNKNIFTYVGSLSIWQCFEETLDIYKAIEEKIPSMLKVYTKDIDTAEKLIKSKNILNYSVKYVENNKLPDELKDVKYGFLIRENNIVNNVATPTKLSTYLSCGVIPIYSDCISDFYNISKNMKYSVPVNNKNVIKQIINNTKLNIDSKSVYDEYSEIFNKYFCRDYYIKEISKII